MAEKVTLYDKPNGRVVSEHYECGYSGGLHNGQFTTMAEALACEATHEGEPDALEEYRANVGRTNRSR